ncbi:hypothetical protein D3C86_2162400 [compost metagenome]
MQFGELVDLLGIADGLAHLERDQLADHPRTEHDRQQEREDPRARRAKRDVLEKVEKRERVGPACSGLMGLVPIIVNSGKHQ